MLYFLCSCSYFLCSSYLLRFMDVFAVVNSLLFKPPCISRRQHERISSNYSQNTGHYVAMHVFHGVFKIH